MKRIKVRVTTGPSSLLKMTNHWLVLWLMNGALQAKKKKTHANVKKLQAESKNLPSKILQYRYICKFHVYSAGKVFLPIFSWPSKAMRHIKHLHHTGGRKYKQQGSLWKSVVCMKMSGSSLQTHRARREYASVQMHIKSCPSRACPRLLENKMETVYSWAVSRSSTLAHIQWLLLSCSNRFSFAARLCSSHSPRSFVFFICALRMSFFYSRCSNHTEEPHDYSLPEQSKS